MAVVNANFATLRNLTSTTAYVSNLSSSSSSSINQNISGTLTAANVRTSNLTVGTTVINPLVAANLSGLSERTATLETISVSQGTSIRNTSANVSSITTSVASLRTTLNATNANVATLSTRIASLESTALPNGLAERLTALETQMTALAELVSNSSLDPSIGPRLDTLETFQTNVSSYLTYLQETTQLVRDGSMVVLP